MPKNRKPARPMRISVRVGVVSLGARVCTFTHQPTTKLLPHE